MPKKHGGKRPGAGRPKSGRTERVGPFMLSSESAKWLSQQENKSVTVEEMIQKEVAMQKLNFENCELSSSDLAKFLKGELKGWLEVTHTDDVGVYSRYWYYGRQDKLNPHCFKSVEGLGQLLEEVQQEFDKWRGDNTKFEDHNLIVEYYPGIRADGARMQIPKLFAHIV